MAITVIPGTLTLVSTVANTITIPVPSNQDGDMTLIQLDVEGNVSARPTTPSGWTSLAGATGVVSGSSSLSIAGMWYRVWQPGDPTSVTITTSGATARMVGLPLCLRGINKTTPIETNTTTSPATSARTHTATGLTAVSAKLLVCGFGGRIINTNINVGWTPPSGMTTQLVGQTPMTTTNPTGMICTKPIGAGDTGDQTATNTAANVNGINFTVLVNERPAGTATVLRMKGGVSVTTRYKGQP